MNPWRSEAQSKGQRVFFGLLVGSCSLICSRSFSRFFFIYIPSSITFRLKGILRVSLSSSHTFD